VIGVPWHSKWAWWPRRKARERSVSSNGANTDGASSHRGCSSDYKHKIIDQQTLLHAKYWAVRPYSNSSLTLNEWRFNLSFSWVSMLLLNSCRVIALQLFKNSNDT
jgi:hypothetical protein